MNQRIEGRLSFKKIPNFHYSRQDVTSWPPQTFESRGRGDWYQASFRGREEMARLPLSKCFGALLCFLFILPSVQSRNCTIDDYKRYITPCDTTSRTRSVVYYLNNVWWVKFDGPCKTYYTWWSWIGKKKTVYDNFNTSSWLNASASLYLIYFIMLWFWPWSREMGT